MASTFHELSPNTVLQTISSGSPNASLPTLIFLHFWGGSARTFNKVVSPLSSSYQTLSISFRGWGLSTGPPSPSEYSIQDLASDIETLTQKLNITNFVLVGHSMGGKVAQLIAGRKAITGLRALILLAPAPPTALSLPEDMRVQQREAYGTPQSAEFVVKNVLSSAPISNEEVTSLVSDMLKGNEFAKAAWPDYGMGEDILEQVKEINVPTLVLAGELDKVEVVEKLEKEVVRNIKGSEMVIIEKAGHLLPVEAAEDVVRHIDRFIKVKLGY